jgi:uncharacterized protein YecT (DUF1311 family)
MPFLLAFAMATPLLVYAPRPPSPCPAAKNTIELDECFANIAAQADSELARYLSAARRRLDHDAVQDPTDPGPKRARAGLDTAEASWRQYREAECGAVYDYWSAGSIRGGRSLSCQIKVTRLHTHTIWAEWLTYEDSTQPILPEPVTP